MSVRGACLKRFTQNYNLFWITRGTWADAGFVLRPPHLLTQTRAHKPSLQCKTESQITFCYHQAAKWEAVACSEGCRKRNGLGFYCDYAGRAGNWCWLCPCCWSKCLVSKVLQSPNEWSCTVKQNTRLHTKSMPQCLGAKLPEGPGWGGSFLHCSPQWREEQ